MLGVEQVTIYALCDPDGAVRYIGQTNWSVAARLREHWERCTWESSRKALWLRSLREGGQYPLAHALEIVDARSADEAEQRQITAHRAAGCALTNARSGGRGAGAHGRTGFWLTYEERGQLERLARRENRSVQGQIHQFIYEGLERRGCAQMNVSTYEPCPDCGGPPPAVTTSALVQALVQEYSDVLARRGVWEQPAILGRAEQRCYLHGVWAALDRVAARLGVTDLHARAAEVEQSASGTEEEGR